jgi:hypothetical protein
MSSTAPRRASDECRTQPRLPDAVWATGGQVRAAFAFSIRGDKIAGIEVIMAPTHLAELCVKID